MCSDKGSKIFRLKYLGIIYSYDKSIHESKPK